jgi:chromosome segregation ATPase
MYNDIIKIDNIKHKEVYNLSKIPDVVLIKSLQTEVGQLKSYIEELKADKELGEGSKTEDKEKIKILRTKLEEYEKMSKEERKAIKEKIVKEEYIATLIKQKETLEKEVKSLRDGNEKLIIELVKLRNNT